MRGRVWFKYTIKRKKMNSLNLSNKKKILFKKTKLVLVIQELTMPCFNFSLNPRNQNWFMVTRNSMHFLNECFVFVI